MAVIIPANFVFYFVRSNAEQALSTANIISCCLLISVSSFIIDFESHIMCWARGVYSTFCSYGQKYSIPLIKHSRKKKCEIRIFIWHCTCQYTFLYTFAANINQYGWNTNLLYFVTFCALNLNWKLTNNVCLFFSPECAHKLGIKHNRF